MKRWTYLLVLLCAAALWAQTGWDTRNRPLYITGSEGGRSLALDDSLIINDWLRANGLRVVAVPGIAFSGAGSPAAFRAALGVLGSPADSVLLTNGGWVGLGSLVGRLRFQNAAYDSAFLDSSVLVLGRNNANPLVVVHRTGAETANAAVWVTSNEIRIGDATGASFVGFSAIANWYQLDVQINSVSLFKMNSNGQITSDVDGTFNIGDHQIEIHSGTNCSEIDPAETSWTNCSSSRDWKTDITEVNEDSVLAALRFVQPYRYRYTGAKVRESWANPDTVKDLTKQAELRAKIQADSLRVRQGFMGQDVARLSRALNPSVEPDTTGYSLDPIVQGQQVAILHLLDQVDAIQIKADTTVAVGQLDSRVTVLEAHTDSIAGDLEATQEQVDNLQYIVIGLAALNGVVLVLKKGNKGKNVLEEKAA